MSILASMEAVFFIGIGVSLFLGTLIASKKKKEKYDYILLSWLLVTALHLVYFYVNIVVGIEHISKYVLIPGALLSYISAPILYLYIRALVSTKSHQWFDYLVHLIPYFLMLLAILYLDIYDERIQVGIRSSIIIFRGSSPGIFGKYALIMAFSNIAYLTWSIYLLQKHRIRIKQEFSYTEKITLNWLRHWLTLEFIGFWISFIIIWVADFQYIDYLTSFKVISVVLAINVFVIGFFGVRQGGIALFQQSGNQGNTPERYVKSSFADGKPNELIQLLEKTMLNKKPYLNPRLNANELASMINISRHALSELLNDKIGTSFYDYVNGFRVREFKAKVDDSSNNHLTLLGIALESGFNSKSSFNLIFKKAEGITPTQYKKAISGEFSSKEV